MTEQTATLIKKQSSAKHSAVSDEAHFVIDGLKHFATARSCAFQALRLCSTSGTLLVEAHVYTPLIQAVTKDAVSCGALSAARRAPGSRTESKAEDGTAAALAGAYVLLLHCAQVLRDRDLLTQHCLGCESTCNLLKAALLPQHYKVSTLTIEEKDAIASLHARHKSCRLIPQAFAHSAQAVLLAACRLTLEPVTLAEEMKVVGGMTGLLDEVARALGGSVAVLLGRQPPSSKLRTSECLWYINMALGVLERMTGTHPRNCHALAALRVRFGAGRLALVPRVLLATLPLAQNAGLLTNKAVRLCLATALQLLMNLTHSADDGHIVLQCAALEGLATLLVQLVHQNGVGARAARDGNEGVVVTDSEELPSSQSLAAGARHPGSVPRSTTSLLRLTSYTCGKCLEHITSALCVLSNLCEHNRAAARQLACLRFDGSGFRGVSTADSRHTADTSSARATGSGEEEAATKRPRPGNDGHLHSSRFHKPPRCKSVGVRHASSGPPHIAGGSRRRAGGEDLCSPGPVDSQLRPVCSTARGQRVHGEGTVRDVGVCRDGMVHGDGSQIESQTFETIGAAGPVRQSAAAEEGKEGAADTEIKRMEGTRSLEGAFLLFLARGAACTITCASSAGAAPAVTPHPLSDPNPGDDVEGASDLSGASQSSLRLYMAILLGVLVAACPELVALVSEHVDMATVAHEMECGLTFYARHGAIEDGSAARLQAVIMQLRNP